MDLSINAASAHNKLLYIIDIISTSECTDKVFMKSLIRELTNLVNGLNINEKIALGNSIKF